MKHNVYFSVPSKLDYICKYLAGSSYSNICLQRTTASGRSYRPDFLNTNKNFRVFKLFLYSGISPNRILL